VSKRKYEPGAFVPCSRKHKSCSPAHASLVAGYRAERERQEKLFEAETGNYEGDIKWHKENGHQLITFKTWLKANKRQNLPEDKPQKTIEIMQQNEVDQIFNQMMGITTPAPAIENGTNENEEECNCDCDMCCRNDHIACCNDNDPCCLSRP
jgi:hypothetical protein